MKRSDHAAKRLRIIVRRPWIRRPKNLHPQHLTIAHAGAGQATENHRDHRADLGHPGLPLCPLCPLWQTPCPARHSPPDGFVGPLLTVIPTGGPKARSGGTRLNSTSTRHRTRSRSNQTPDTACSPVGVNVDLQPLNAMTQPAMHPTSCPNNQAPNIMTQQQKRNRCATLKNGFLDPRCFALLRTASLGMTMMGPPDTRPRTG